MNRPKRFLRLLLLLTAVAIPTARSQTLELDEGFSSIATIETEGTHSGFGDSVRMLPANNSRYAVRDGAGNLHAFYAQPFSPSKPGGALYHRIVSKRTGAQTLSELPLVPDVLGRVIQVQHPTVARTHDYLALAWFQVVHGENGRPAAATLCFAYGLIDEDTSSVSWDPPRAIEEIGVTPKYLTLDNAARGYLLAGYSRNAIYPYDEVNDEACLTRFHSLNPADVETIRLSGDRPARDVGLAVAPEGEFCCASWEEDDPSVEGELFRTLYYSTSADGGANWEPARPLMALADGSPSEEASQQDPSISITYDSVFLAAHAYRAPRGIRVARAPRTGGSSLDWEWIEFSDGSHTADEDGWFPMIDTYQRGPGYKTDMVVSWQNTDLGAGDFFSRRHYRVDLVFTADAEAANPVLSHLGEELTIHTPWRSDPSGTLIDLPPSEENPAYFESHSCVTLGDDRTARGERQIDLLWTFLRPWPGLGHPYQFEIRHAKANIVR